MNVLCQLRYTVNYFDEDKRHAVTTPQLKLLSGSQGACDVSSEAHTTLAHEQPYT